MKVSKADERLLFEMICSITGVSYDEEFRREMIINNIGYRMQALAIADLGGYLLRIEKDEDDFDHLVSLSTIHTTSWFREKSHFDFLHDLALKSSAHALAPLRLWFSACSTGQEVYTAGLVLEKVRQMRSSFEYRLLGSDIDVISLNYARKAIYPARKLPEIPAEYQEFIHEGSGKTEGLFTVAREIRDRTTFSRIDLNVLEGLPPEKFDVVACRNVLIYFKPAKIFSIVSGQQRFLKVGGHFIVGHCEAVEGELFGLQPLGGSVYQRGAVRTTPAAPTRSQSQTLTSATPSVVSLGGAVQPSRRALIVDDSPTYRKFLTSHLRQWGFEVQAVDSAAEAERAIMAGRFDLVTLDLHMPDRSGGEWIKDARKRGVQTPVVIVSEAHPKEAIAVVEVLEREGVEFIDKVTVSSKPDQLRLTIEAILKPRGQDGGVVKKTGRHTLRTNFRGGHAPEVILIGASTGGPQALTRLLNNWSTVSPPIVVVQHISKNFFAAFAERLAQVSGLRLGNIKEDPILKPNHLYMALDDYHLKLQTQKAELCLVAGASEPRHGHRPAVDDLFLSAADSAGGRACSVLLTGMGADGAQGMLALRKAGAQTFAQCEDSCVVFGMPKEAIVLGGAEHVGDIDFIRQALLDLISIKSPNRKVG